MIKWLDGVLLIPVQWLCNRVQTLTGLTKFVIEKWMLIVMTLFFATYATINSGAINTLLIAILTLFMMYTVRYIEKSEERFLKDGSLEHPITNAPLRLMFFCSHGFLAYISFVPSDYIEIILALRESTHVAERQTQAITRTSSELTVPCSTSNPRFGGGLLLYKWYNANLWINQKQQQRISSCGQGCWYHFIGRL